MELSKDWYYDKNGGLLPEHVTHGSTVEVWWKCHKCNYEWLSSIHKRTHTKKGMNKKGCVKCDSLGMKFPEIFNMWHPTKNGNKTPFDFMAGSEEEIWLICDKKHVFDTTPKIMTRDSNGNGCQYCHGNKFHVDFSLGILNPKLASEWHPTKNGTLTPFDVTLANRNQEVVWWLCPEGHEYENTVRERHYQEQGCTYCAGKKVCTENSLAFCYPLIAKQWHPTKNVELTPETITRMSGHMVWWFCEKCKYEWEEHTNNRARSSGKCPNCKELPVVLEESITEYQTK